MVHVNILKFEQKKKSNLHLSSSLIKPKATINFEMGGNLMWPTGLDKSAYQVNSFLIS